MIAREEEQRYIKKTLEPYTNDRRAIVDA